MIDVLEWLHAFSRTVFTVIQTGNGGYRSNTTRPSGVHCVLLHLVDVLIEKSVATSKLERIAGTVWQLMFLRGTVRFIQDVFFAPAPSQYWLAVFFVSVCCGVVVDWNKNKHSEKKREITQYKIYIINLSNWAFFSLQDHQTLATVYYYCYYYYNK